MSSSSKHSARRIGEQLRRLRESRGWSQVGVATQLQLSQSRLSAIERGQLSLTAEEFLDALKLFNVPASEFVAETQINELQLQNALERLGATHLRQSAELLPSEELREATDVIREVMTAADSPRHIAALAPVLVAQADRINFLQLLGQLQELGLRSRLGWLIENVTEAIGVELETALPARWKRLYRRASIALEQWRLEESEIFDARKRDVLDREIRSQKSLASVAEKSSQISKRWNVVTAIQVEDFVDALRASRVGN